MLKMPRKNTTLIFLLWFITLALFILSLFFYFSKKQEALNISMSLLGVFAMLSIALQTFTNMDKSTKETVKTILDTSTQQIKEFKTFVDELKNTNVTLGSVSSSLKVVSDDVVSRQKLIPNLYVTFIKNQNQITLKAGEINEVEFCLHNSGVINASNPNWSIFLSPQIEIIDRGSFKLVPQGVGTPHENYNMLYFSSRTIDAKSQLRFKIKIKTNPTNLGVSEIPFSCSCDNAPQNADKLLINYFG